MFLYTISRNALVCITLLHLARCTPTPTPTPTLNDILLATPTVTSSSALQEKDGLIINSNVASMIDVQPSTTVTVWVTEYDSPTTTTTPRLTSTSVIDVAQTIGLIMPNPQNTLYVDLNYTFGFVDIIPRPAPTYGSWIRQIQPLLIFPDYTVNVFPSSGTDDPTSSEAVPIGSDGLCGATVENYAVSYPFIFKDPGWYLYVVNQTYMQANVTDNNQCSSPIIQQQSFFATQTISIALKPTWSPGPASPTESYTVFATVSTSTPSTLPYDPQPTTSKEKLGIIIGVACAVVALVAVGGMMCFVRKKRRMEAEALAFFRLQPADQQAFLMENPNSFLNPNRPARTRTTGDKYGQGPPAPPGTMAYAIWYSQQLYNRQFTNQQQPQQQGWNGHPQQMSNVTGGMPVYPQIQQWGYQTVPPTTAGYHR